MKKKLIKRSKLKKTTHKPSLYQSAMEHVDKKVYAAMLEKAKKDKNWAEITQHDVGWLIVASDTSKEMLHEYLTKSVEQIAEDHYKYLYMRSHMTSGNKFNDRPIDPAAKREWEELSGKKIKYEKGGAIGDTVNSKEWHPYTYYRHNELEKAKLEADKLRKTLGENHEVIVSEQGDGFYVILTRNKKDYFGTRVYEKGGSFEEQAKEKWNSWTPAQRKHFMNDHERYIEPFMSMTEESAEINKISNYNYDQLTEDIKWALKVHLSQPAYKRGGNITGRVEEGTIIYANTGVPVRVLKYDDKFGGRVLTERADGIVTGMKPLWRPISKFSLTNPYEKHETMKHKHGKGKIIHKRGAKIKVVVEYSVVGDNVEEHFDDYASAVNFYNDLTEEERNGVQVFSKEWIDGNEGDVELFKNYGSTELLKQGGTLYKRGGTATGKKVAKKRFAIKNQYAGKTVKEVWNAWNEDQRMHFLLDHRTDLGKDVSATDAQYRELEGFSKSSFDSLPKTVKDVASIHIFVGQYAKGGKTDANYKAGDLVFAKHEGQNGLIGLVVPKKSKAKHEVDVYFRGLRGEVLEMEPSDIEPVIGEGPGYMHIAEEKGDIGHYKNIATKLGITLNPIYQEYLDDIYDEYLHENDESGEELKHGGIMYDLGGTINGTYTKDYGDYQLNSHGDAPDDYKIICKHVMHNGKKYQVCYHETNDHKKHGVEVYAGENYIVGSKDRSYSRVYHEEKGVPAHFHKVVEELKAEHKKVFNDAFKHGGTTHAHTHAHHKHVGHLPKETVNDIVNRIPFKKNQLEGKVVNDTYVVYAHGYYPLFVYKNEKWYINSDRFSKKTQKLMKEHAPEGITFAPTTREGLEMLIGTKLQKYALGGRVYESGYSDRFIAISDEEDENYYIRDFADVAVDGVDIDLVLVAKILDVRESDPDAAGEKPYELQLDVIPTSKFIDKEHIDSAVAMVGMAMETADESSILLLVTEHTGGIPVIDYRIEHRFATKEEAIAYMNSENLSKTLDAMGGDFDRYMESANGSLAILQHTMDTSFSAN